jgi:DNA-binding NarL/FixJ family response regulator
MPRVLIAAPPDLVAELDRSILKRSGVERVLALHPESAFEAIRTSRPDMVILGEAAGSDTCTLLRKIRGDASTRAVTLAVISRTPPSQAEEAEMRRAGANVVLTAEMVPDMSEESIDQLLDVPLRREARMAVRFVVWSHVGPDNPPLVGQSINVSVRGLLLQVPEPVDIGSKLELTFTLPGDDVEIRAVGKAVREHPWGEKQIGVEFLILRDAARDRIRAYVNAPPPPPLPKA